MPNFKIYCYTEIATDTLKYLLTYETFNCTLKYSPLNCNVPNHTINLCCHTELLTLKLK